MVGGRGTIFIAALVIFWGVEVSVPYVGAEVHRPHQEVRVKIRVGMI